MIFAVLITMTGITIGVISGLAVMKGMSVLLNWLTKDTKK